MKAYVSVTHLFTIDSVLDHNMPEDATEEEFAEEIRERILDMFPKCDDIEIEIIGR